MTIAEIKSDYIKHKITYSGAINLLKMHHGMPGSIAKRWVDGWIEDWWETSLTRSST